MIFICLFTYFPFTWHNYISHIYICPDTQTIYKKLCMLNWTLKSDLEGLLEWLFCRPILSTTNWRNKTKPGSFKSIKFGWIKLKSDYYNFLQCTWRKVGMTHERNHWGLMIALDKARSWSDRGLKGLCGLPMHARVYVCVSESLVQVKGEHV